jgi:hypothetical protein
MKDFCFVSLAFGDQRYIDQQKNLRESILKVYPDANILFWTNEFPPYSKSHFESLYGFKVHAITEAIKRGFKKILWLDPAMVLVDKIDDLLTYDIVAVKDEHKVHNPIHGSPLISNRMIKEYNIDVQTLYDIDWRLVGGSLIFFDFNSWIAQSIFTTWFTMESKGLFGSQQEAASEQINGHRNDETCLSVAMYLHGFAPLPGPQVRYCIENNPMFVKKHFK